MERGSLGVVAYLGAWVTTIGGVWFLFEKADETLAPEVRDRLGSWLEGVTGGDRVRQWPSLFVALFDRVFGTRHVSWFCIRRSAVATFVTTWTIGAWWIAVHPPNSLRVAGGALLLVSAAGLVFSLVPDYLSLLETRFILGRLSRGGSAFTWLALDLAATLTLAGSIYLLVVGIREGAARLPQTLYELATFKVSMTVSSSVIEGGVPSGSVYAMPMAPFFYATFFTSVWLWVFAGASLLVRFASVVLDQTVRLRGLLDVREKPGRSLGLAAVVLVTIGYLGAIPLALVVRAMK